MPDLTLSLVTNELSQLTEKPPKARKSLQNPEEQDHCLLTRSDIWLHQGTGGGVPHPVLDR